MSINTNRPLNDIPMYTVCLFFYALALTRPLVLVVFFYNQRFRSDGHMPKRWELHLTVTTGWLLFQPVVVFCPIMMAENHVMYQQRHSGSEP